MLDHEGGCAGALTPGAHGAGAVELTAAVGRGSVKGSSNGWRNPEQHQTAMVVIKQGVYTQDDVGGLSKASARRVQTRRWVDK